MHPPAQADAGKAELRRALLAARAALSAEQLTAARRDVAAAVLDRADTQRWRCVSGYVPLRTEPGSLQLLAGLRAAGVRVLVPVLLDDRDLDWAEWLDSDRSGAPLGRDAIGAVDATLVPALAVAADGTRLGRGGGSYDRALRRVASGTQIVALLHRGELLDSLPRDRWDVPVTAAASPDGWWIAPASTPELPPE